MEILNHEEAEPGGDMQRERAHSINEVADRMVSEQGRALTRASTNVPWWGWIVITIALSEVAWLGQAVISLESEFAALHSQVDSQYASLNESVQVIIAEMHQDEETRRRQ